jgi:hypothetical protein
LAGAAIIFIAVSKLPITNRKENLITKIGQILLGAVVSLVVGFGLTWLASDMVGLHIPQFTDTALFLSITSFSFFLMISAVLSWLGIRSIALFALLLFFGAPLLSMAPEMMSPFYRDWIFSWLPMRFMIHTRVGTDVLQANPFPKKNNSRKPYFEMVVNLVYC